MGIVRRRGRRLPPPSQQASRFVAIRAIVDLARDGEDYDVAAEALLVIGASPQEITAALLGTT